MLAFDLLAGLGLAAFAAWRRSWTLAGFAALLLAAGLGRAF